MKTASQSARGPETSG
ncbi:hypothetical protein Q9233_015444 [Columba guinea]|nr:hypothetical protein Q9233_015444 [Columba guinea]